MGLILIRHAQTDAHDQCFSGQEDIPLNGTGKKQAEQLAATLADYAISGVLSSPLSRARATVAPMAAARDLSVELRPALMEINYGELEGQDKAASGVLLRKNHICTPVPGGESLWELWLRLAPVDQELRQRIQQGEDLAVVGHYWSNRLLLGRLMAVQFEHAIRNRSYKPGNASAIVLEPSDDRKGFAACRWITPAQAQSPLPADERC